MSSELFAPAPTSLTPAQHEAAMRAVGWLTTLAIPFAVILPDGTKHGALEVMPPKRHTRKTGQRTIWLGRFNHYEIAAGLAVGKSHVFEIADPERQVFWKALENAARQHIGAGNFVVTAVDAGLELLRMK